ncbi:hypothetical protein, partial [Xanthomonas citri]|uniref:hypothetical protein n=1 Tax=Xanthomonas citri TaxID=346 RepID=UPI0005C4BADA
YTRRSDGRFNEHGNNARSSTARHATSNRCADYFSVMAQLHSHHLRTENAKAAAMARAANVADGAVACR